MLLKNRQVKIQIDVNRFNYKYETHFGFKINQLNSFVKSSSFLKIEIKMKLLICVTFIFSIGTVCGQTLDSTTAVVQEANGGQISRIVEVLNLFLGVFDTVGDLPLTQFEPIKQNIKMFADGFSALLNETNTKTNEILSKLMKNGQIVPSQIVRATMRLAKVATNEFDQLEKLFLGFYQGICTFAQSVAGSPFESFIQFSLSNAEYLYKLTICARSQLDEQLDSIRNGDEDDLSALISLMDVWGRNLNTSFSAFSSILENIVGILADSIPALLG